MGLACLWEMLTDWEGATLSIEQIANACQTSKTQIRRALLRLEEENVISIEEED